MSNPILDNRGVDPDESALGDFSVPAAPAQAPALEGAMPFDESNLVDSLTTPLAETPSLADKYTGTPVVQSDPTVQPEPTVQPQQITRTEYLGLPIPQSIDTTAPGVAPIPYKQYDAPGITPGALETLPPIDVRNLPPVLYEGPTSDDIEKQLRTNREEIRGLIEKGDSPLLIENPLFLPQPQLPGSGFRPDSTRNAFDQWKIDVGLSAEYRRPDGSIDWSAAWSKMGSNAMYIFGLPGNFLKAGVADINNAVRGIALLSGGDFLAMAGGKEEVYYGRGSAVRPNFEDVGKNGANIWQALKGRQYNASEDYDPAEPFGLGDPEVPWYRDVGFWGGFFIDVLTPDILLESTVYEPLGRGIGSVFKKVAPQKLQTAVGKAGAAASRALTTPITLEPVTKLTKPLRELIGSAPVVKVASPGMQAPAVSPNTNFKNGLAQPPLPSVEASGWNTRNPWTSPPDVPALKPGRPAPAPRPVPRPTNLELPIPGPPAAPRPVPIKGGEPSVPTSLFQYPDEATQNALEPIRKMFDVPGSQAITKSEGFLRDVPPIDRTPLVIDPNSANSIVRYFNPAQSRGRLVPGGPDRAIIANEVVPFSRPRPPLVGAGDVPPIPPPPSRQTLRDAIQDTLDEGWELGDGSRSYSEDLDNGLSLVYNVSRNGNVYTPSPVAVFTPNLPNLVNDPEAAERIATSLLEQHNRFAQSNQYLFVSVDDVRFFKEGDFLPTIYGLGFRPYELEPDTFYNITRRLAPEELAQKFSAGEFNVKFVYEPPSARAGMVEPPTVQFPRGEGVPPRLERPKADDQAALTRMEPQMGRVEELQSRPKPAETPTNQQSAPTQAIPEELPVQTPREFPRKLTVPRIKRPGERAYEALIKQTQWKSDYQPIVDRDVYAKTFSGSPPSKEKLDTLIPQLQQLITDRDDWLTIDALRTWLSKNDIDWIGDQDKFIYAAMKRDLIEPHMDPNPTLGAIPQSVDEMFPSWLIAVSNTGTKFKPKPQNIRVPKRRTLQLFDQLAQVNEVRQFLSLSKQIENSFGVSPDEMKSVVRAAVGDPNATVFYNDVDSNSLSRTVDPDMMRLIQEKLANDYGIQFNIIDTSKAQGFFRAPNTIEIAKTASTNLRTVFHELTHKLFYDKDLYTTESWSRITSNILDETTADLTAHLVLIKLRPDFKADFIDGLVAFFRGFEVNYSPFGISKNLQKDFPLESIKATQLKLFNIALENAQKFANSIAETVRPIMSQAVPEELLTNNLPDVVDYLDAPAPGHLLPEVPEVGIRSLEDINALGRFLATNDGTPVPPFASMDELGDFVGKYPELANTLAIEGPMVPDLLKNTDVIPVVGRNNTYMLSAHTTWDNIDTVVRASIDADVDKAVQKLRSTAEKTGRLSVDSVLDWVRTQSLFDEFSTGLKQARSMVERLTASVNNPSRYDTLPDIGRRAILDEQPFNRTVGVRGVPANAVEPMGTTFYHGTKVDIDPDDLPFIDPIAGGARGEAGPALYVTNNRNTARYYAQAPIQENVPLGDVPRDYTPGGRINQVVIPPDIKLLDAQDAADDTIYEVFKQAASDAGLPKKELTAYKSYFTRVKPDNVPKMFDKFTEYLRKSDIYDERMVLDFQRRVNTALFDLGYDGAQLPDGIALYNPAVIDTVKVVERVAESNPLNQAIARFNADSTVAAHNPRSGSSLVNMYESGVKVQANMLDQYKGRMNTLESYQTDLLNSVKQQTEALFPDVEQQLDSVEKAVKQRVDNLVQEYDANWNPCDF